MSSPETTNHLVDRVDRLLNTQANPHEHLEEVLETILGSFQCVVGTIHLVDPSNGRLKLFAQRGVPESIMDRIQSIPIGKGMAGLAAQRGEPVQVCNLQSDESGQARSGARATQMEGSISIPMMINNEVHGVLGVAKPEVYEYSADEVRQLEALARLIGEHCPFPS